MYSKPRVVGSIRAALVVLGLSVASSAFATPVHFYYTDWITADPSGGTAHGVITLPDFSTVSVDFAAINPDGSPGSFTGAVLNGSWAWGNYPATYTSDEVANAPSGNEADLLQLVGGDNQTYTVHLSAAIKDPLMDIVSLGDAGRPIAYDFNSPFTILSQGPAQFGGTDTSLQQSGNDLTGNEGNGAIKFVGTYTDFSWTVPKPEDWHGFTFGIRTTEALEPNPPSIGVPEPSPAPLFVLGLAGIGIMLTRRRSGVER